MIMWPLKKSVGLKAQLRQTSVDISSQHVRRVEGCIILRILARVPQPAGGYGQPRLQRVCACEALYGCEKMHAHRGSSILSLVVQALLFSGR